MRETVAGEYATADLALAGETRARLAELTAYLRGHSQIVWGEHCSECAYPACYASCAFYTPRPDLNCRRFEGGIERVRGRPGDREVRLIRFRRWGKLEGHGPAPVHPVRDARRREARDEQVSRALATVPAPFAVVRNLSWRWNTRKTAAVAHGALAADAFVVEAWSADGASHDLTLTFLEQDGPERHGGGLFQAQFTARPAYGRLVVPAAEIAARIDLARPWLVQIEPVGEAEGRQVVFGLTDFCALDGAVASIPAPAPAAVPPLAATPLAPPGLAKVLVWDLDETLWSGTLAEDGADGVRVRPEADAAIRELDSRGVLQSIASKNDHAEAMAALARFGLDGFFLHPQVNWGPKSGSLARIATALDLGLDSLVFVDDQPFERGEVAATHPMVRTLTHGQVGDLLAHPWFDHPVTAESGRRRAMYQAEAQRAAAFDGGGEEDYLAFLRGCGVTLEVWEMGAADVARIHELSQRTNQLNFTGAKLSREEVERRAAGDPDRLRLVMRCEDRFGDYGVIGFADLDLREGVLELFFMSCRVQRKRVEQAMFALLAERLAEYDHRQFAVRFRGTQRNGAGRKLLQELGFAAPAADGPWTRSVALPFADADVVRRQVRREPARSAPAEMERCA